MSAASSPPAPPMLPPIRTTFGGDGDGENPSHETKQEREATAETWKAPLPVNCRADRERSARLAWEWRKLTTPAQRRAWSERYGRFVRGETKEF